MIHKTTGDIKYMLVFSLNNTILLRDFHIGPLMQNPKFVINISKNELLSIIRPDNFNISAKLSFRKKLKNYAVEVQF